MSIESDSKERHPSSPHPGLTCEEAQELIEAHRRTLAEHIQLCDCPIAHHPDCTG